MTATPYVAIDWTPSELIDEVTMDQIQNNIQWLYENKPNAKWQWYDGTSRTEGTKILGGAVLVPIVQSTDTFVPVYFGNFFSQGATPAIVVSPNNAWNVRVFYSTSSFAGAGPADNTGFLLLVATDNGVLLNATPFSVNWIALGY